MRLDLPDRPPAQPRMRSGSGVERRSCRPACQERQVLLEARPPCDAQEEVVMRHPPEPGTRCRPQPLDGFGLEEVVPAFIFEDDLLEPRRVALALPGAVVVHLASARGSGEEVDRVPLGLKTGDDRSVGDEVEALHGPQIEAGAHKRARRAGGVAVIADPEARAVCEALSEVEIVEEARPGEAERSRLLERLLDLRPVTPV